MADLHNDRLMTTVDLDGAANRIKDAIEQAIAAEREACAKILDPPESEPITAEAKLARTCRTIFAEAIRARGGKA
jgi:hypothetical protein